MPLLCVYMCVYILCIHSLYTPIFFAFARARDFNFLLVIAERIRYQFKPVCKCLAGGIYMRICFDTAREMANALLDAVELAEKYDEEVVITSTLGNKWIALVGDSDTGTRFVVNPPRSEPDTPPLRLVS